MMIKALAKNCIAFLLEYRRPHCMVLDNTACERFVLRKSNEQTFAIHYLSYVIFRDESIEFKESVISTVLSI